MFKVPFNSQSFNNNNFRTFLFLFAFFPLLVELNIKILYWNHTYIEHNNCIAKGRLGAWNIQELPLLAASFWMETSAMAGKSWQPNHGPPHRKGKQAPVAMNKQWKEGGKGGENCLDEELPLLTTLQVTLKAQARTPQRRERRIPTQAHMQKTAVY